MPRYVASESVDLVYLDPPFNSNADYNVLFAEKDGTQSAAQIKAFTDTWRWDTEAARWYDAAVHSGHGRVPEAMTGFRSILGESDMLAYLANMAPCLIELHRVLKPTGSIYLHCDPTASHYLKILLDAIFGGANFQGDVIWRRTVSHLTSRRWARLHDTILVFAKDIRRVTFHPPRVKADAEWIEREYRHEDKIGRYSLSDLTAAGTREGPSGKPWRGIDPRTTGGRHWRYHPDTLEKLDAEGRIYWPVRGRFPKLKIYLEEAKGKPVGDLWTDILAIGRTASERLGYPTQKPEALLDRIVAASSNAGDIVLDPFCGCGTAIATAQKLGRRWVGIDVTHLAVGLIKHRLRDGFGLIDKTDYAVVGEPEDLTGATELFESDAFQFQAWALGLIGARVDDSAKKGADKGIDGKLWTHDGSKDRPVVISVKGGKTGVSHVRDLRGVVERTEAAIGVLITLQDSTRPMREEAASAGFTEFHLLGHASKHPRLQILSVEDLLAGKQIDMPAYHRAAARTKTFKQAPKAKRKGDTKAKSLGFED